VRLGVYGIGRIVFRRALELPLFAEGVKTRSRTRNPHNGRVGAVVGGTDTWAAKRTVLPVHLSVVSVLGVCPLCPLCPLATRGNERNGHNGHKRQEGQIVSYGHYGHPLLDHSVDVRTAPDLGQHVCLCQAPQVFSGVITGDAHRICDVYLSNRSVGVAHRFNDFPGA
jgi:hypothetical protein